MTVEIDPKIYEKIVNENNIDANLLKKGFKLVEKFIHDRGLILYGGMAIDFALRLKGSSIYPDDAIPDYDFFSPDSVKDSYDLTDIFAADGMNNARSIVAMYVRAMKNSVSERRSWVADIAYIPPDVFDRLPFLVYKQMKFVHPHYQMVDIHQSLSAPFQNPTLGESIFNRFKKDIERYGLLAKYYPLMSENEKGNEKSKSKPTKPSEIHIRYIGEVMVGFAAYGAMLRKFNEFVKETTGKYAELESSIPDNLFQLRFEAINNKITFESFNGKFEIIHKDVTKYLTQVVELSSLEPVYIEAFLNVIPKKMQFAYRDYQFIIYDTSKYLITKSDFAIGGMQISVASIQYQLKLLLAQYLFEESVTLKNIFLSMYQSLIAMINYAEKFFNIAEEAMKVSKVTNVSKDSQAKPSTNLHDAIITCPFLLSIDVYGNGEKSERDEINTYYAEKNLGRPVENIPLIPSGYTAGNKRPEPFDYNKSKFFNIGGKEQ